MNYVFAMLVGVLLLSGTVFFLSRENSRPVDEKADFTEGEAVYDEESADDSKSDSSARTGRTLDLSDRGLTQVPTSVFNQTDIEVLDLSHNKLDGALQAEVRHLQNLRVLDLSDNNFTGVPAEVGQLSKLEILDLSNNPITGLPYEIGNLKNLQVLDLRGTNYASQDLEIIRQTLSSETEIKVD